MTQQKKTGSTVKRQKQDAALHKILLWFGGAVAAELAVLLLNRWFDNTLIHGLAVLIPIVSVLAMVYYLYQREFFTITLVSAFGIFGLWLYRNLSDGSYTAFGLACLIIGLAAIIGAVAVLALLQRHNGVLRFRSKSITVFRPNTSFALMYITCALAAVSLLCGWLIGLSMAYYMIFVLVAWLFSAAVYYTVKLM